MNILIVGIGGQGTILASNIISDVLLSEGYDVKKSEIHGMSQRGGSVISHVRYSKDKKVYSPMVPLKSADLLLSFDDNETKRYKHFLKDNAQIIQLNHSDRTKLANPRSLNIYGLGLVSKKMDIDKATWEQSIKKFLKPKLHADNLKAFEIGLTN